MTSVRNRVVNQSVFFFLLFCLFVPGLGCSRRVAPVDDFLTDATPSADARAAAPDSRTKGTAGAVPIAAEGAVAKAGEVPSAHPIVAALFWRLGPVEHDTWILGTEIGFGWSDLPESVRQRIGTLPKIVLDAETNAMTLETISSWMLREPTVPPSLRVTDEQWDVLSTRLKRPVHEVRRVREWVLSWAFELSLAPSPTDMSRQIHGWAKDAGKWTIVLDAPEAVREHHSTTFTVDHAIGLLGNIKQAEHRARTAHAAYQKGDEGAYTQSQLGPQYAAQRPEPLALRQRRIDAWLPRLQKHAEVGHVLFVLPADTLLGPGGLLSELETPLFPITRVTGAK